VLTVILADSQPAMFPLPPVFVVAGVLMVVSVLELLRLKWLRIPRIFLPVMCLSVGTVLLVFGLMST